MRLIARSELAIAVSRSGGLGFVAAGTDVGDLKAELQKTSDLLEGSPVEGTTAGTLPIGVGFINWGVALSAVIEALREHIPAAVWFFAPHRNEDLVEWTDRIRDLSKGRTKVWVQVGTVSDAVEVVSMCQPDVVVVQGHDAGGHGLAQGASVIALLPEVADALSEMGCGDIPLLAAGGIVEGRGVAAARVLGANGVVLGTRFLASEEATIAKGYQNAIITVNDGAANTARTSLYDQLRGTTGWPSRYNGRGVLNRSHADAENGMDIEENKKLYSEAIEKGDEGWSSQGRLTTYAGSGVGLVKKVMKAGDIVEEVRSDALAVLCRIQERSASEVA